jgi:hypothetical protein
MLYAMCAISNCYRGSIDERSTIKWSDEEEASLFGINILLISCLSCISIHIYIAVHHTAFIKPRLLQCEAISGHWWTIYM